MTRNLELVTVDLAAAAAFMAGHARLLDRRRFQLLLGESGPEAVLAALDGYRNPDGGYGWGLEPDLRSPESQPGAALHAFEVFADVAPMTSPRAVELCDWLASVSLPDGGVPFTFPLTVTAGTAPWWARADTQNSSLHITAAVLGAPWRVAAHDPAVAKHPWLADATRFCLAGIDAYDGLPHAIELNFVLRFLDAVADAHPEAIDLLRRLGTLLPADGKLGVEGGADDEAIRPLDYAPTPNRPVRSLVPPEIVAEELRRLAAEQRPDGGWTVDFTNFSPASALEWRGYATVRAIAVLRNNSGLRNDAGISPGDESGMANG